jgi:hypothetical protein
MKMRLRFITASSGTFIVSGGVNDSDVQLCFSFLFFHFLFCFIALSAAARTRDGKMAAYVGIGRVRK